MASCSLRQPKPAIHATPSPAISQNESLDTTNRPHGQLLLEIWWISAKKQACAMSCYIHMSYGQNLVHVKLMEKNIKEKTAFLTARPSAPVRPARFWSVQQPTRTVAWPNPTDWLWALHHPPASSWPVWMEELHLWDDDLCQLSAMKIWCRTSRLSVWNWLEVVMWSTGRLNKVSFTRCASCYENCIISFQSSSACKCITMAAKRQNRLYKESRLLLLLSSTRGSTDSKSGLSTKMNLQGSAYPTGCVDP